MTHDSIVLADLTRYDLDYLLFPVTYCSYDAIVPCDYCACDAIVHVTTIVLITLLYSSTISNLHLWPYSLRLDFLYPMVQNNRVF